MLFDRARTDEIPRVRRQAVHSLGCQRCKPLPLQRDLSAELLELAQQDSSVQVQSEAVFALAEQPLSVEVQRYLEHLVRKLEEMPKPGRKQRVFLHDARYALKKQTRAPVCTLESLQ